MRERLTTTFLILAIAALVLWLAQQLASILSRVADVLLVFLLAWALAYLLLPVVSWVERRARRLRRIGSVAVVYAALLGIVLLASALAAPVLTAQLQGLVDTAPAQGERIGAGVRELQAELDARGIRVDVVGLYATLPDRLASGAASVAADLLALFAGVLTVVFEASLVLIVAFFMLVDGDRLWRTSVSALPADLSSEAELLRLSADRSFGGYLRGQLLLGLAYGVLSWILLLVVGVPFAALLGLVSGLLMVIPFFGAIIAMFPPVLLALAQSVQTATVTFIALVILQNAMLNVIAPRLLAHTVGLHPLVVFLALLLGARVAGFWGVFLAIPIAGVLNVFGQYLLELARGERTRSEAARFVEP